VLEACRGKGFVRLRDEALIRLYANAGARLSKVGNLLVTDLDLNTESVHFHGKGAKDRRVRFGPKTARATSGTCGPATSTRARRCRTCGWPTAARHP
jgi:integrase/recombinase XerC